MSLTLDPALAERLVAVLERLSCTLPAALDPPDWARSLAFRWRRVGARGYLQPVRYPHRLRLADLQRIDRQKATLDRNVRQFLAGRPCNNVLLWGARGTGKSSLVKALLNEYADRGLRLIEVDKHDLIDLPDIVESLFNCPERFLLYCDDLSFEANDPSYKALKAMLDGYTVAEYPTTLYSRAFGASKAKIMRTIRAHLGYQGHILLRRLGLAAAPTLKPTASASQKLAAS